MEVTVNENVSKRVWGMDVPTYCMLLHLSHFLHYVFPFGGVIAPVVMWAVNKDEDPLIDQNGRVVLNWMLSCLIYFSICFVLLFVIIGFPLLVVLGILSTVFSIIGALKAQKGQVWEYPLSIPFFNVSRCP